MGILVLFRGPTLGLLEMEIGNHPLKVYFPLPGHFYIFSYRSHNKGKQLIIAKTEDNARNVAFRIMNAWNGNFVDDVVKVMSFHFVEMVGPSFKMIEEGMQILLQEKVRDFYASIQCAIKQSIDAGHSLPSGFIACNPLCENSHYCDDCDGSLIKLSPGVDRIAFYKKNNKAWYRDVRPGQAIEKSEGQYSRAEVADDHEDLLVGIRDRDGSHIVKRSGGQSVGCSTNLFYCRELKTLDTKDLQKASENLIANRKEKYKENLSLNAALHAAETKRQIENTMEFFRSI